MADSIQAGREIDVTITLNADENEVLEVASGVLGISPDEFFTTYVAPQIKEGLKLTLDGLRKEITKLPATARLAVQGRALARETLRRTVHSLGVAHDREMTKRPKR